MSVVQEALTEELKARIKTTAFYREQIETAKTNAKKNLYTKKLRKNNQIVADILIALDKLLKEQTPDPSGSPSLSYESQ